MEDFGCAMIVIVKFVDKDIIEFLSCFHTHIYIYASCHIWTFLPVRVNSDIIT